MNFPNTVPWHIALGCVLPNTVLCQLALRCELPNTVPWHLALGCKLPNTVPWHLALGCELPSIVPWHLALGWVLFQIPLSTVPSLFWFRTNVLCTLHALQIYRDHKEHYIIHRISIGGQFSVGSRRLCIYLLANMALSISRLVTKLYSRPCTS